MYFGVAVRGGDGVSALVLTAEAVTPKALAEISKASCNEPELAIARRRAEILGLSENAEMEVTLKTSAG